MGSTFEPNRLARRDLIKRAAAIGVVAVPATSLLSGCASSGGGGTKQDTGTKTAANPLGVADNAPLDVVIFDGGFGDDVRQAVREDLLQAVHQGQGLPHGDPEHHRPAPAASERGRPAGHSRRLRQRPDQAGRPAEGRSAHRPDPAARLALDRRPEQEGPRHPHAGHRRPRHGQRQVRHPPVRLHRLRHVVLRQAVQAARLDRADDLGGLHLAGRRDQEGGHRALRPPGQVPVLHQRGDHGPGHQERRPGLHEPGRPAGRDRLGRGPGQERHRGDLRDRRPRTTCCPAPTA